MNIPVFIINLERRPDRLNYMAAQLNDIGIAWECIAAHDMKSVELDLLALEVAADDHAVEMGSGSQCCALTNFDIYRKIVAEGIPAALILQDDIELSAEIVPFLTSVDWLPEDIHLVQFEKYGKTDSYRLLGPSLGSMPLEGCALRRLHSRTAGAACYLITQEGAARVLAEKRVLRMPIDHFLFSPNVSPIFHRLGVAVISPALARQREDGFVSDIEMERQRRRKKLPARLRRLWQEVNRVPSQLIAILLGARWRSFGYTKTRR